MNVISREISKESDQSQSKHDALHHHPWNQFFWLQPAPPVAAGCFHLSSRGRLCCLRCVNVTLVHYWGYSFAYTPIIIASHLCYGASAAALRCESHLEIDLWQTFSENFSMTSHPPASVKQKWFFLLSTFGPHFICPEPSHTVDKPSRLAQGRQRRYIR